MFLLALLKFLPYIENKGLLWYWNFSKEYIRTLLYPSFKISFIFQFIQNFKKTTILGIPILLLQYRNYYIYYNIEISNRNVAYNNYSNIQHYTNQITHKQPVSFIQEVEKIKDCLFRKSAMAFTTLKY